ncbi:MAG: phage major capsid protein [Erythrobacter sp.]|nr:phage major capsid protein [Erythrobacter sp.]MDZ4272704.1 phage major capsid protein [Erythrobacter sp.]
MDKGLAADPKVEAALSGLHSTIGNILGHGEEKGIRDARGGGMRPFIHPGATKGSHRDLEKKGVKVHHGEHGEVFELKAGARLADVIETKETPDVPMERWLAAAMLGDRCEDKAALQFANEVKSLSGGTTGVLLPASFQGQWVDNLRNFMVLEASGMTTATMLNRTVSSSRVVSDPPVGWRAEGAALVAGDPTFELQNLVAKTLAVRVQSTAELAYDSPDFGSQLLQVMGRALAHEIDRVGLVGTGTADQPRGIVNTPGIQSIAAVGSPTHQDMVAGLQRLLEANVPLEMSERNAIMSPRTWGTLASLQATDEQPIMRPRALENMAYRPTNSITNDLGAGEDESQIIMGDFSDLVMGVRMEASVEALRLQSFAESLRLEFVGWTRLDFMVRRPASFCVLNGVTA